MTKENVNVLETALERVANRAGVVSGAAVRNELAKKNTSDAGMSMLSVNEELEVPAEDKFLLQDAQNRQFLMVYSHTAKMPKKLYISSLAKTVFPVDATTGEAKGEPIRSQGALADTLNAKSTRAEWVDEVLGKKLRVVSKVECYQSYQGDISRTNVCSFEVIG